MVDAEQKEYFIALPIAYFIPPIQWINHNVFPYSWRKIDVKNFPADFRLHEFLHLAYKYPSLLAIEFVVFFFLLPLVLVSECAKPPKKH